MKRALVKLKYLALERYVDLLDERQANPGNKDYVVKTDAQLAQRMHRAKTDTVINRIFNRFKVKYTEDDMF